MQYVMSDKNLLDEKFTVATTLLFKGKGPRSLLSCKTHIFRP